jgi:polar amino acid transport system permease protein
MLHVILPQSIRLILPPFGNEFSSMMRTTSLLSVISFNELLRVTNLAINETYAVIELYAVAAVWYLLMYSAWIVVQRQLERYAASGSVKRNMSATDVAVARG